MVRIEDENIPGYPPVTPELVARAQSIVTRAKALAFEARVNGLLLTVSTESNRFCGLRMGATRDVADVSRTRQPQ
jgi:hypothetical protein